MPPDASIQEPEISLQDIEVEKVLIQQAQWIVERYESANEGLMTRSASLAGFAGIELSLVGQMVVALNNRSQTTPPWGCTYTYLVFSLVVLTVVSLLSSIVLLINVLRVIRGANHPNHESIIKMLEYIKDNKIEKNAADTLKIRKPIEQILMMHRPKDSYPTFLLKENDERGKNFRRGFEVLITSQVLLAALVLVIYWR